MSDLSFFQDREEAIGAFDRLWDSDGHWILAFTGFSGHGKSTLLDWLEQERCQSRNLPYALIGLGEFSVRIGDALNQILEAPGFRPHLRPAALEQHRQHRQRALEDRQRRAMALTQSQDMQNSAGGQQTMSAGLAEAFREMDRQTLATLCENWLDAFQSLPTERRFVILLDNYDAFQESAALEDLKLFWHTLERAHLSLPHLRVVLASREELRQAAQLRAFQSGLALEPLGPLSLEHSNALLLNLGVADSAFREAVFARLAQGHPLITRMAADAWARTPGGIPARDVPALNSHEQAVEWVQGRILDQLPDPLKQAVRWGALLRQFNAESLNALLDVNLSDDEFRDLTRYAFIRRPRFAPGEWACHDLVRSVQSGYLRRARPDQFKAFHARCAQYFGPRNQPLTTLYHQFFVNTDEAFEAWRGLEGQAQFHFQHDRWAELMEMGLAVELPLTRPQQAEVLLRAGRRHYYRAEWDLAVNHDQQALTLFRDIGAKLGEANVLKAIGDVQQFRKQSDAALASYQQALTLFRDIGAKLGEANVLQSQGRLFLLAGQAEQGLKSLQDALTIYETIGSITSQANIYFFLAQLMVSNGHIKEAIPLLEKAVALGVSVAPGHPVTQHMQNVLEAVQAKAQ